MKRYIFFLILLYSITLNIFSDNYGGNYSAILKNEGNASWLGAGKTIIGDTISALYFNPAAITNLDKFILSTTISKPFTEIDGLSQGEIDLLIPNKYINIGLSYSYFKIKNIREANLDIGLTGNTFSSKTEMIRLSVSQYIFDDYSCGLQIKYFKNKIYNYSASHFAFDLGGYKKIKDFDISLYFRNLFSTEDKLKSEKEKLPISAEIGLKYELFEFLKLSLLLYNEEYFGIDFKSGIIYELTKNFKISAGYIRESKQFTGGVNVTIKSIKFDYGISSHSDLELTHKFSINYKF